MDNNSLKKFKSDFKEFIIAKIYENIENNKNLFTDYCREEELSIVFNEKKFTDEILSKMIKNKGMFKKVLYEVVKNYEENTGRELSSPH